MNMLSSESAWIIAGAPPRARSQAVLVERLALVPELCGRVAANVVAGTADRRDLRHHAAHPSVDGPDRKDVAAAIAGPPDPDPIGIDVRPVAEVGDRVAVRPLLRNRVELPSEVAFAVTGVGVVEGQGHEAGRREQPRVVVVQEAVLDAGEPVTERDRGEGARRPQGGRARPE